ncbi:glycosyltransferase family 9 protein [Alphaproteobacteria bacterium]|jgi:ADP-heptose:LPS heptosyltransferase|nr:glycosyltransferase family 9 protein [Alphaproteobacteria bacterium]|tara:strand:- start:86 stop:1036 length:951 start_codon:yes stop_codon:yes gene_type:complete
MKKLLFIGNTRLGDAVMSTGLLNDLCDYYNAKATVVCGKVAAPVFEDCPIVNKVIKIKKRKYSLHWLDIWKEIRLTRWDIICDLRSTPIIWLVRSRKRIVLRSSGDKEHRIVRLSKINPSRQQPMPKIWISKHAHIEAKSYLNNIVGPFIVIGPTANWAAKVWPSECFALLIQKLLTHNELLGAKIILVGGPGEEEVGEELISKLKGIKPINLIGKPILPTAAIFSLSKIFIGNDSGLMHLAAATGIPTLGLFGPTDNNLYAPSGKNAMYVRTPESPEELMDIPAFNHRTSLSLMRTLTIEMVENKVKDLLQSVYS